MTTVNPNNEKETQSDIFRWKVFKLTSFFIGQKIMKHLNDL